MAKKPGEAAARVYAAAERFVEEGLRSDSSLFSPHNKIWTLPTAQDLQDGFVKRPDTSADSFEVKFQRQLAGAPTETIQLAGELLYVHLLISTQLKGQTKLRLIERVLSWSSERVVVPEDLALALDEGLCNAGRGFLQHRPFMLMFLVELLERWKALNDNERVARLDDPWTFKSFVLATPAHAARSQQQALLHLVFPDTFEPIVSDRHKRLILQHFAPENPVSGVDLDRQLLSIREELEPIHGVGFSFYSADMKPRWLREEEDVHPPTRDTEDDTVRVLG